MIPILSIEQIRAVEAQANADGFLYTDMMDRAGQIVADRVLLQARAFDSAQIIILVGSGNNGGDGLVAARHIAEADFPTQVVVYMLKNRDNDTNLDALKTTDTTIIYSDFDEDYQLLPNLIQTADIMIDALLGIGIRPPLRETVANILQAVNKTIAEHSTQQTESILNPSMPGNKPSHISPYVIAVDCPSGLACDTGTISPYAIRADETVTFVAPKPGLITFPGAQIVGQLVIADIGIDQAIIQAQEASEHLVDANSVRTMLPDRKQDGNKGSFGRVLVVAGSVNYIGAPGLAALAAYRSGSGLVSVGTVGSIVNTLAARLPEPTWLILPQNRGVISEHAASVVAQEMRKFDSLLIGPGLGQEDPTRQFLINLLTTQSPRKPLVIDADGLNILSKEDNWWEHVPDHTVITPHPGEMSRLTGIPISEIQANRVQIAHKSANKWGLIVLLKGAHTVIAAPNDDISILPFKNSGMATAGSGDVLAGIIVSLLGQGLRGYEAAIVGGYLHGLAGELCDTNPRAMIASDLTDNIGRAFDAIEGI